MDGEHPGSGPTTAVQATAVQATAVRATAVREPSAEDTGPRARRPAGRPPSRRPALIVVGLALLIIVFFGVLAAVTNVTTPPPVDNPFAARVVPGTGLVAVPATRALRPVEQLGQPPGNIVDAVAVPRGATVVKVTNNAGQADQYDQQVTFSVAGSQLAVLDFYKAEMTRLGWHVFSTGTARQPANAIEVLGQKGGSDGWYWEMGAVVSPTTFTTGQLSSPGGGDVTRFTVRLFQVPDSN